MIDLNAAPPPTETELVGPAPKRPFRRAGVAAVAISVIVVAVVAGQLAGSSGNQVKARSDATSAVSEEAPAAPPVPPPDSSPHPPVHPAPGSERRALPTTPTMLSHGGPAVRGALVTFSLAGLADYLGQSIALTLHAGDASSAVYPAPVDGNGTALVNVYLPRFLSSDGPCATEAPCDRQPLAHGPLGVSVTSSPSAGGTTLIDTEITVVPSTPGHLYPVELLTQCGPARVELDDAVWVPAPGAEVPGFAAPTVAGVFFFSETTARYTPSHGTPITMVEVDPGVVDRLC